MSPKINNSLPPDKDTRIAQLEQALAIEAALEKVRVRTMTMQKSEELAEVASLVFQQLEAIGLVNPEERFHFSIHDEQKDTTINWMTEPGGKKIVKGFEFQLTKLFYPLDRDFTAWKNTPIWERKKLLLNTIYEGETLKKLLNFVSSNPDFISNPSNQEFLENPPNQLAQNAAHFSHGVLCVTSSIKFPKEKLQILQRFAITFEQTYTRFLDLQKAEEQTREAQIEAALERVRAASMAMHKTEELAKVVTVLFNQLQTLEIDIVLAIVAIFHTEKRRADAWFSPIDNQQTEAFLVQLPFEPWENTTVKDWQEGKPFGYISVSGKEKVSAYAKQIDAFNNWNLFEAYADNLSATAMEQTNANHQFGHLGIIQLQKATEAEKAILLRFAKVFEQTYTRFLDLQKAEKQTREAQIEAALERVRAASMAMHKSKELPNVALAILKEANYLDIAKAGCAIGIFDMEERTVHSYGANMVAGEIVLGKVLNHSIDSFWVLQESVRRIDIGDSPITIELKDKHLQEVADYINDEDDSGVSFHLENKSIYYNLVPFYEYSVISISSLQPLLASEFEILERMARTLRMSYIRFLDLQKAETQAREAQIEAALERVRAASMAMHKSDELRKVATVLFNQVQELNIEIVIAYLSIFNLEEHYIETWFSPIRGIQEEAFYVKHSSIPWEEITIRDWKEGKDFSYISVIGKEAVMQHIENMQSLMKTNIFVDTVKQLKIERIEGTEANHKYGNVAISQPRKATEEEKSILKRFAKVFEQTCTRFLDLQKAEAQAREAQAREAQIEAALERVRAASMAMHKSEDLPEVALVTVSQLEALGIQQFGSSISIADESDGTFIMYSAHDAFDEREKVLSITKPLAIDTNPIYREVTSQIQKGNNDFSFEIKGKVLKGWIEHNKTNIDKARGENIEKANLKKFYGNVAAFRGLSSLSISSAEPINEADRGILRRMADVFGQSYQRYLDLQKAEAQVREAQVEAALEKIRAKSMAMHHSSQLKEVVEALFHEMNQLEIRALVAWLSLIYKSENIVKTWVIGFDGKIPKSANFQLKIEPNPHIVKFVEDWSNGEEFLDNSYKGEEKLLWLNTLIQLTGLTDFEVYKKIETLENLAACNKYGTLGIASDKPYSSYQKNVLQRFTAVFEQTYTRFLDLQKAEEQAREAQIEAALERVRAASMAMHKTEELSAVALVTFQQLESLGIQARQSWITILRTSEDYGDIWTSLSKTESIVPNKVTIPLQHPAYQLLFKQWKSGVPFLSSQFEGAEVARHFQMLNEMVAAPVYNLDSLPPYIEHFEACHQYGVLSIEMDTQIEQSIKDIVLRFAKVFEQTYTRFLDLQRAEAQAKEAQIEAALERVRAASMAMHKTNQLIDVTMTLFEELKVLEMEVIVALISLLHRENKSFETWMIGFDKQFPDAFKFGGDYNNLNPKLKESFDKWLMGEEFIIYNFEESQARQLFLDDLVALTGAQHLNKFRSLGNIYTIESCHKYGTLGMTTTTEFTAYQKHVLKRFSIVFEQAYTRFLDIQKAEALAREAQIEAALERVRARSLAMHNSSELHEVVMVVHEQLKQIGLNFTSSNIGLPDDTGAHLDWKLWAALDETIYPTLMHIPYNGNFSIMKELSIAKKSGQSFFTHQLDKKETPRFWKYFFLHHPIEESRQKIVLKSPGLNLSAALLKHTIFALMRYSSIPFTPEENNIISRFGKVFEQTYTRFLDLQKAEAQAREAQIEAALERVRAASMAMHKTNQLIDVTMTLFEELKVFEIEITAAWLSLIHRENKSFETWVTGFDEQNPEAFKFGGGFNNLNSQLKEVFNKWLKGEEFIVYDFVGNQAVQSHLDSLIALTGIQHFSIYKSLDYIQNFVIFHKYGTLGMGTTTKFTAHQKHVLKRFSIVFEQAYTRFQDIQKAEAQAREAQIEAALEKVRAKTASMYKSTELEAVVSLVFQQLRQLNFDSKQCIIGIIDKETLETEIWQSVDAQSGLPNSYKIPKLDHPFIQQGYDAYLKGEQYHERELSGAAKKSYDKLIFEQTDLRKVPAEVKAAIIQNEKIVTGSAYMSHGVIQVIGAAALSYEKAHILQRFAAAIDLTYTRFLDIQKAEQQKIQLEKVFSENQRLLHSILPAPIAEQIRQGQQTVVKRFEQVSILFADIVGFTVLSDRISPQEVVDILNGLFSKFDDLTDKYGLEKIKTIGDAYMVAAGVPEEKDNHAQLMFAFAKDMLQTLQAYNQVIGTDLKIRIGISSGPVVAGVIGKKKFAYDLWGDTVNTAARMEAYGHADCIQVSPTTYAILKKEATFEKIPNVAIKGKGTMDVYLWTPFTG